MKTLLKNLVLLPALIAGLISIPAGRVTAQIFTTLHNFTDGIDGVSLQAGLVLSGNVLYGTTEYGGAQGGSTLFAVNTDGSGFRIVYNFADETANNLGFNTNGDAGGSDGTLVLSGNTLYGASYDGGTNGTGAVFAVNTNDTFTLLHSFSAANTNPATGLFTNSDGYGAEAGMILSGSTLYGTTEHGGTKGYGVVFKVNTNGTGFVNLHNFTNGTDGSIPHTLVISGSTLYGTSLGYSGNGTVFALGTNGTGFTTLHSFIATNFTFPEGGPAPGPRYTNSDGVGPGGLILSGSTLYGTAGWGGTNGNGTVFALNTNGMGFTILHNFAASRTNSSGVYTNSEGSQTIMFNGLVLSSNILYGTAYYGGSAGNGTVFSINTNGTGFTTLYSFNATGDDGYGDYTNSDGANPYAGLTLSGNTLYGTAKNGGTNGDGTVFALSLSQQPVITFTFTTNNGAITITGYTGTNPDVIIPDTINGYPVTSIGTNALYENKNLTSVTIGTNVTSVGDYAFEGCSSLTSATIPNGITNIGYFAFDFCTSLTNITLPDSVIIIGGYAFAVTGVITVTIPDSVTTIGYYAFFDCPVLTNVNISNSVTSIGSGAFDGCTSLTAITVATNNPAYSSVAGVLFDKSQAALIQYPAGKAGASYTISNSVTSIGLAAFSDCINLTNVTIPNGVTNIGNDAFFNDSSLISTTIPKTVSYIADGTFSGCTSLAAITVDAQNPFYNSVNGVLFGQNGTTLIQYPAGKAGTYTIPNGVTSIEEFAFYDSYSVTSVTIPNGVTNIGSDAFDGCFNLTSVTIGNNVTSISDYAFEYCTSLTGVYFEDNAPTPSNNSSVFYADNNVIAYYLPGTVGWGSTFDGIPTALWFLPNPLILNKGSGFGVQSNQFGFTLSWATNISVVVQACTNLASPVWFPVATNTLANGTSYFSDPKWTNYPSRFYRLRSP